MPIRTNRGRAAVYRRLWGWPMRSPRHLTIVVVVVGVLVIAIGVTIPQLTGSGPSSGAATGTTGAATTSKPRPTLGQPPPGTDQTGASTTSQLPSRITPTETPTSAPPTPQALDVAESWAKAWVHHPAGVTNEQWLADLRPFTTEEYITEMATVEPANISATKVTGAPEATESFTSSVKVKLSTDDGDLLITVIDTPEGWRVAFYEQVG